MRALVTGSAGQLGTDVVLACRRAGDDVVAVDRSLVDVTSRDDVLGVVGSVRPDVVIHCAAFTAVDRCETEPDLAFRANALAPRWVAEACRRFDAHLVHLSTDYVFDGAKPGPYVEWDRPNPLSAYGRSKLAGEQEALGGLPGATVVRTSWLCGEHGPNMLKTALKLLPE
jgi:dTDP-4-dehydrorhamnose reductase